jgi:hypothetical protein
MTERNESIVVVGAGNVGLHAVLSLALVSLGMKAHWEVAVVDFDRVEAKDVNKGYPLRFKGRYKAEAAVEMAGEGYGRESSARFTAVAAAAQSVPGLLRQATAVFNGTDSPLDAAYVSIEARNAWEVRMSTGVFGQKAVHTLEVQPEGFTLGEASYDRAAWADTARYQCEYGIPENAFAGIPQPFGAVAGSLAVHFFLSRMGEDSKRPYMVRINGEDIIHSSGSEDMEGVLVRSQEVSLSYEAPLSTLWSEAVNRLSLRGEEDLCLGFHVPIVTRRCASGDHEMYRGFERYPVRGRCAVCREKTYLLAAPREVSFPEIASISHRSLRELHCPAGASFEAWTRDGKHGRFHLPFRIGDVPPVPEDQAGK